jgi:hypothetical protein
MNIKILYYRGLVHTEGIVAALAFTLGAASLIAVFYEITKPEKDKTDIDSFLTSFGFTPPLWLICAMQIFRMKIPSYFPTFTKRVKY